MIPPNKKKPPKLDVDSLVRDPKVRIKYELEIANRFSILLDQFDTLSIDDMVAQTNAAILFAAKSSLKPIRRRNNSWITSSILDLAEKRSSLKQLIKNGKSTKDDYKVVTRQIRKEVLNAKETWVNGHCAELEAHAKSNDSKKLFEKVKEIAGDKTTRNATIRDKNNKILVEQQQISGRWKEYCEELYNYPAKIDKTVLDDCIGNTNNIPELPITICEVEAAIHRLKTGKSPGSDEINGELFKYGGPYLARAMFKICTRIWIDEKLPEEWTKSLIVIIPKKGDASKCENNRIISLINHASKIILEIIR